MLRKIRCGSGAPPQPALQLKGTVVYYESAFGCSGNCPGRSNEVWEGLEPLALEGLLCQILGSPFGNLFRSRRSSGYQNRGLGKDRRHSAERVGLCAVLGFN